MQKFPKAPRAITILTASIGVLLASGHLAQADSSSWAVDADGNWITGTNWEGGVVPGISGGTTNTDIATFGFPLTADRIVTVPANWSIGGITFSNPSDFKYTLQGGGLRLSSGGVIQTAAGNGNHTDTISTAIAIQGENGTASFTADATSASSVLSIGAVTGVSTGANVTTLTLNGSNTGANRITGIIGNGGTGKLAIVKAGTGAWTLSGANTFTGGLTVNAGILRATTVAGALGAGTLSLGGGELQLANTAGLNFGRATTVTADAQITSDVLISGSAGVTHTLSTLSIGSQTLTVAGGSNVTSGTAGLTFNGATTLTGSATFNVVNPIGGGTTVLTFSNAIGGGANTFTKTGNGTVLFSGAAVANTYTGLTTVAGGELQLGKTAATNALAGNVTVGGTGSKLTLTVRDQIVDTATVAVTAGGTFNLNGLAETVAGVTLTGSAGSPATLDLAGTSGTAAGNLKLTGATPTLTFGTNTQLIGAGNIGSATPANPLTFNFNGGQVSGGTIQVSNATVQTSTIFNITAGMGGGTLLVGGSGNLTGTVLAVNLNQTGSINVGSTILAYSNTSGGQPTILNVTVANTATGMSGGIISTALAANAANPVVSLPTDLKNNVQNTLTFTSGGTGFTLSGGVIDVRSSVATAGYGAIITNGNNLTISGGTLLGNSLTSTTGTITLSSGYLGLRSTGTANFTISTSAVSDGRTIQMVSGSTGTFSATSGTAGQRIIIASQSSGGTWDMGTVNAGVNYTITNSAGTSPFGSSFATYSIGANSGLNGVVMGANAIPTLLTLGTNASFFVASSTAAARTYNVGVAGGGNDIVVAATGNIGFGINNTNTANAQIINLNRDKGDDTVSLISNGASAGSAINIASNQSGAGNLYVMTKTLTLNAGVTFGGTGGIFTDLVPGNATNEFPLSNFAGNIAGASSQVTTVFNINGTMNGTNTVNLNQDNTAGSTFAVGSTATIGGTQTWVNFSSSGGFFATTNFSNAMTAGANWTNGSVSFTTRGSQGTFEASTSTVTPSAASNYKFNSLALAPGGSAPNGGYKLLNSVQNDGGSAKEAFYTGTFSVSGGIGDGSNGHYLFNLNGQDLYVDRFNGITGLNSRGLSFQNDALNTVSEIRAVSVTGDTLVGGSFQVLNGATLQFNGGNVNNLIFSRNTGGSSGTLLVADTAAAPNNGVANQFEAKRTLFHNGTSADIGTFTSFLGSGTDRGTSTAANFTGTDGTVRVIGGGYSTSGYILNPVGTIGLIDTTDGVTDTTLNDVLVRGNTASDSGGAGNATAFPALIVAGTTTINGNLIIGNAVGAANQATLRVGGDSAVGYSTTTGPSAHVGTGTLNVAGNLTVESTVNLSIQSNGNVSVGGNVSIAGVGTSVSFATNPITGMDGVGINAGSNFTLNGNTGAAARQTVNVVPSVGKFHVGEGSGGTLTGKAAQAVLTGNLTAAGNADINGSASSLNLGGNTLNLTGGSQLYVGGRLEGNGTVAGGTVTVGSGGTISPGNSPGTMNTAAQIWAGGGSYLWELNSTAGTAGADPGWDLLNIGGTLGITATSSNQFTIRIASLTTGNTAGNVADFQNGSTYQFLIADATSTIAFDRTAFALDTSNFSNPNAGWNLVRGDNAAITGGDATQLYLTVVPEPSSLIMLLGSAVFLGLRPRSRSRRSVV